MKKFSKNHNILIIAISISLIIMLIGDISRRHINLSEDEKYTTSVNLLDFLDTNIKSIKGYYVSDFDENFMYFYEYETYMIDSKLNNINFLDLFAVEDAHGEFQIQHIFFYVVSFLLLGMLILPLILLIFSIYDLIKSKYTKRYKYFLLFILLLGLLLVVMLKVMGYNIGLNTLFYLVIVSTGITYSYFIEIMNKEREYRKKHFIVKLITCLLLASLIFLTTTSIGSINGPNQDGDTDLTYDDFVKIANPMPEAQSDVIVGVTFSVYSIIHKFDIKEIDFVNHVHDERIVDLTLLIPILMVLTAVVLIVTLVSEISKQIDVKFIKINIKVALWTVFIIEHLTVSTFLILSTYLENQPESGSELKYSVGFFILIGLTFILAIYQSLFSKRILNN